MSSQFSQSPRLCGKLDDFVSMDNNLIIEEVPIHFRSKKGGSTSDSESRGLLRGGHSNPDLNPFPVPNNIENILQPSDDITPPESTDDINLDDAERERAQHLETIDRETNLWRFRNCSIPLFYFILGFALKFPTVALRKYMIDELKVSPANQSLAMGVVMYIPFSLKIFFAFLSDGLPIFGQRRKPYMIFGALLGAAAWIALGALTPAPTVQLTSFLLFLGTFGIVWCDTMVDTLVVERMRYEHGSRIGRMQTTCWMLRYLGMFVGILMGGWILTYGKVKPQELFLGLGLMLLGFLFPSLLPLADEGMTGPDGEELEPPSFKENVSRIWQAVQLNSIWKPMIFVYIWNILPNDGDAWVNYILNDLKFSEDEYSYILAIGTVSGAVGALMYRLWLRNTPLHPIFYITILISTVLSCIPFVLIFKENRKWGIPDLPFALGNEVINDVAGFIMYMPVLIMCSKLCPNQVEGSVYALTCVVNNIGNQIAMNFSALLTDEFEVTRFNFDRLWELHLVVVLMMLVPMGFIWLCPNRPGEGNPDEMKRTAERLQVNLNARRSKRRQLQALRGEDTQGQGNTEDEDSDQDQAMESERLLTRRRPNTSDTTNTGLDALSTEEESTTTSPHGDSSGEPNSEDEEKSSGCCACCVPTDDDDEPDVDETTVTDEEFAIYEAETEAEIARNIELSCSTIQPSSAWGGGLFLFTIFASLTWSTIHAVVRISKLR